MSGATTIYPLARRRSYYVVLPLLEVSGTPLSSCRPSLDGPVSGRLSARGRCVCSFDVCGRVEGLTVKRAECAFPLGSALVGWQNLFQADRALRVDQGEKQLVVRVGRAGRCARAMSRRWFS